MNMFNHLTVEFFKTLPNSGICTFNRPKYTQTMLLCK